MKELIISKELLSEVLNISKESIVDMYNDGKYLLIRKINSRIEEHNIYELDFICREWAYIKGFVVEIGVHPIIKQNRNDRDYFYAIKTLNGELLKKSNVDEVIKSEPTATFKACNWILENNK